MFRHFATAGNLEKRYIGTTDEPILPVSSVSGVPEVEIVLASPLLRCRETAGLLYPRLDPVLIEGFRECDFGAFEGKNYRELTGDQDYQAWIDSGGILPFPGGESMASFTARTKEAFQRAVEDLMAGEIRRATMIAHGGTLMAILSSCGIPKQEYYEWNCGNGCGYRVRIEEDLWKTGKKECKVEEQLCVF